MWWGRLGRRWPVEMSVRVHDVLSIIWGADGPLPVRWKCDGVGLGAMTEWKDIVGIVVEKYALVRGNGDAL